MKPAVSQDERVGLAKVEARHARNGDIRSLVYSITHDLLPMVPRGAPDRAYQDRARLQVAIADRMEAALLHHLSRQQEGR